MKFSNVIADRGRHGDDFLIKQNVKQDDGIGIELDGNLSSQASFAQAASVDPGRPQAISLRTGD
jgi:hypothetical protein